MTNTIQSLNDSFRRTFVGGSIMLTAGINSKPKDVISDILNKVRTFNDFSESNDPYKEHDFGSFTHDNEKIFWKIDYYDKSLKYGSENPADNSITSRVLTVMLADEY